MRRWGAGQMPITWITAEPAPNERKTRNKNPGSSTSTFTFATGVQDVQDLEEQLRVSCGLTITMFRAEQNRFTATGYVAKNVLGQSCAK